MPCPHIAAICCHSMPFYAIPCPPMPCPYHAACHCATMLPCHDPTTCPAPAIPCYCCHLLLSAAICCHPCHPMLCPQISAPKFRKPTRWWEHSGGGTIEGIIWEHNVDTLWGYNGEAQCGGTRWAQCRGTMWQQQWQHNVGAQSICGGTACRAPTNCCHLLPFHAILCHPMPSHALPYPTMLLPPCYHAAMPPPCYHAMTLPPCLALTMP